MNDERRFAVEAEVPGTPEQVWQAIATGEGIAAWFMPLEIEGREGGSVSMDFGEGVQSTGTLSVWDPPHRFVHEETGTGTATEWLVEARGGGTCVVRVVTSGYVTDGDWEDEVQSTREGWAAFFEALRLYLTHHPGERCSPFAARAQVDGPLREAWERFRERLGLGDGGHVSTGARVPPLAGTVEHVLDSPHHAGVVLRLERPAAGHALVFVNTFRGQVYANVCGYLFGADAASVGPEWDAWMAPTPAR